MDITEKEFKEKEFKEINGVLRTPIFNFEKYENSTYYGLVINKTAEEVYQEWLKNKDNENVKEPTEQEKINAQLLKDNAEQKILIAQLTKEITSLKGGSTNV